MIRPLLGLALPLLGLGAAAAFLGPDLLTIPRGEPLVMVAPGEPSLQAANFTGDACPSTLLYAAPAEAGKTGSASGTRIVAFVLPTETDDVAVAVEDIAAAAATSKTVVLVFDKSGRLVSVGDPASFGVADTPAGDCLEAQETPRAPI